ncbi:MAG: VCBS repeat-containing protein [Bacteroidota bacterium]
MNISIVKALIVLALLASSGSHAQNDSPCNQNRVDLPQVEPRHPDLICLPELGRRAGPIRQCQLDNERYGKAVAALGRLTNDSLPSWIIEHQRCDTVAANGLLPEELLLYHGVAGGLPASENGERIGPSEIASVTKFLAAGDWDHDGYKDLAVRIQIYGDTSFGALGYDVSRLVIFWGNAMGRFSIDDTTQLSNGAQMWGGPTTGGSTDFDGDGNDDLLVAGAAKGLRDGTFINVPQLYIFRGRNGQRWREPGHAHTAEWVMWNRPPLINLAVLDQDHDGVMDIILYANSLGSGTGYLSVLYGRPGSLPDTNAIEKVDLITSFGLYALFSDVTGDGVPELLIHSREQIKVYIGLKGQRLIQQYGPGEEPEHPGDQQWWGHPWARIDMPHRLNPNWAYADPPVLYDLGDANLDGINDIWTEAEPLLLCYTTGDGLDSLLDAVINVRPGLGIYDAARLGRIVGGDTDVIGIGLSNGMIYARGSTEVPGRPRYRKLPPGTGKPVTEVRESPLVHGLPYLSRMESSPIKTIVTHHIQGGQGE